MQGGASRPIVYINVKGTMGNIPFATVGFTQFLEIIWKRQEVVIGCWKGFDLSYNVKYVWVVA